MLAYSKSVEPYLFNQLINSLAVNIWEEEVQFAPGKGGKEKEILKKKKWEELKNEGKEIFPPLTEAARLWLGDKAGPFWPAAWREITYKENIGISGEERKILKNIWKILGILVNIGKNWGNIGKIFGNIWL